MLSMPAVRNRLYGHRPAGPAGVRALEHLLRGVPDRARVQLAHDAGVATGRDEGDLAVLREQLHVVLADRADRSDQGRPPTGEQGDQPGDAALDLLDVDHVGGGHAGLGLRHRAVVDLGRDHRRGLAGEPGERLDGGGGRRGGRGFGGRRRRAGRFGGGAGGGGPDRGARPRGPDGGVAGAGGDRRHERGRAQQGGQGPAGRGWHGSSGRARVRGWLGSGRQRSGRVPGPTSSSISK